MEDSDLCVDEKFGKLGGSKILTTLDGYCIPLDIKKCLAYMPIRPFRPRSKKSASCNSNKRQRMEPCTIDHYLTSDGLMPSRIYHKKSNLFWLLGSPSRNMIALSLMMMILNWFHMCQIITKVTRALVHFLPYDISLEYLIDELGKYGSSDDISLRTLLIKALKPDLESMWNKLLFAQAQTIMRAFKATTQFSKHIR